MKNFRKVLDLTGHDRDMIFSSLDFNQFTGQKSTYTALFGRDQFLCGSDNFEEKKDVFLSFQKSARCACDNKTWKCMVSNH